MSSRGLSRCAVLALSLAAFSALPACGEDAAGSGDESEAGSAGALAGGTTGAGSGGTASGGSAAGAVAGRSAGTPGAGSGGSQSGAGSAGKSGATAGSGGRGSTSSGGKSGGPMSGDAGAPEPRAGGTGTSPYEIECHGDTVTCGDPASLLCLGLRVETEVFGYSCSNECESDADCSDEPASAEAAAGCVDFVNKKYCLLVCRDGDEQASCPGGMYCYVYEGASIGYCLWH